MDIYMKISGDDRCRLTAPGRCYQELHRILIRTQSRFSSIRSSLRFRGYMQRVGVIIPVISKFIQQANREIDPILPTSPPHPIPDALYAHPCSPSSSGQHSSQGSTPGSLMGCTLGSFQGRIKGRWRETPEEA